jgi:hypothetical protein
MWLPFPPLKRGGTAGMPTNFRVGGGFGVILQSDKNDPIYCM